MKTDKIVKTLAITFLLLACAEGVAVGEEEKKASESLPKNAATIAASTDTKTVKTIAAPSSAKTKKGQPGRTFSTGGFSFEPEWRPRIESRSANNFNADKPNNSNDEFNRIRLGFRYKMQNGWMLFVQPQYAYNHDVGSITSTGTQNDIDVFQGYAEYRAGKNLWRLGRQAFVFGEERLIGAGPWGSVGRSFDGIRVSTINRRTTTDVFLAKLGLVTGKTSEPILAGIYQSTVQNKTNLHENYLLFKSDRISGAPEQIWTLGTRRKFTFARRFDGGAETAFQFGRLNSRPVLALASAVNLGYTFPGSSRLRLGIEHDYASGGSAKDGTVHTFDQLFPTNHSHYGTIDYMGWRNMQDLRLSAQVKPSTRWQFGVDTHFLSLADSKDNWYADNGKVMKGSNGKPLLDSTGASGTDIGIELDVTATYNIYRNLSISAGYSRFRPGSFVRNTNGGHANSSDWFFFQTSLTL